MAGHRVSGKADYMMDDRHKTSQSGQILTRQHFLLLVYTYRNQRHNWYQNIWNFKSLAQFFLTQLARF